MLWSVLSFLLVLWVLKFGFGVESLAVVIAMILAWLGFVLSFFFFQKSWDEEVPLE